MMHSWLNGLGGSRLKAGGMAQPPGAGPNLLNASQALRQRGEACVAVDVTSLTRAVMPEGFTEVHQA